MVIIKLVEKESIGKKQGSFSSVKVIKNMQILNIALWSQS